MKINTIKRKYGRVVQVFKRFVLPFGFLYLVFYLFTSSDQQLAAEQDYVIIPGEALDPILKSNSPRESSTKTVEVFENSKPQIKMAANDGPKKYEESFKAESKVDSLPAEGKVKESVPYADVKDNEIVDTKPEGQFVEKKEFDDSDVPGRIETPWSMAKANIPDMHKVRFKGHAITNDTVTLTLMSSADKVFISINKKQIYKGINQRGLHVVVLNQYSARVMAKRVFDTFQVGMEEAFVDFIDDITPGRIIVLAVLDEISSKLTWKGRSKLKELGSRFSEKISYRDMWAMVTRKDGLKIAETFSNVATADTGYEWGAECKWPYNERNQARRLFCIRYEGFGSMCRCDVMQWNDVFFDVDKKDTEELV
ncbi:Protein O-linked-mannose beta-1,2-N-acetylglucosaminyltransferase 1 [Armadillidium nasatum]|uniref:Protein O-linked-mannose beta-1,2-N-acetylglucosaminyltransferase 1 n=1 Tax=Armadillidium nasatum TaxID=96803 RepID=A0A5N5SYM0_9CRUS|nr:Protein O-linked-mannose beta-1,2-N-acetylglucosaminyltransferase 1 [Armadillidium nasatum]